VVIAQCRALAWKDLGRAFRGLDRHHDSIKALEQAESFIKDNGSLMHDVAIVRFNRAVTLQEVGRYDESVTLLQECKDIFRNFGDTERLVFCGIAEGVLLQRLRRFREARETYLLILATNRNIEIESLAALHQAIGFCSTELHDLAAAEANLDEALRLNRHLGRPVEILKIELGRGRLLVRRGDHQLAIHHLGAIRRQLLKQSMPEEAGLCGLEMVDAFLSLSRFKDAEFLSKTLVREFTAAHLNARAITALGYLSEAIEARNASSKLVADVREYIVSLRSEPERDFLYLRPTESGS
jgi:tetratricopeptide (TPR) repeat protein